MERETVRRRINTISAHFTTGIATEDVPPPTTHLFPFNCSSNLSSPFARLDSRLHFGRQASAAQGYFMRQAAIPNEQGKRIQQHGVCCATCTRENKCGVPTPPLFSRPGTGEPRFARPAPEEFNCSNVGIVDASKQTYILPSTECPKYARPSRASSEDKQISFCMEQIISPQLKGTEWSPKINVVESKSNHVISVELPGVDARDIRVEMDDKNIIVKGKRSMKWSEATTFSNDSFATFHRREILQGPYEVAWPIPARSDTDSVSAEFVDGMLQITVPKL